MKVFIAAGDSGSPMTKFDLKMVVYNIVKKNCAMYLMEK